MGCKYRYHVDVRSALALGIPQAIVLSVESLRSLVLSQGVATTNIEADQAGEGRSVVKHKKKGKRNRRGRKAVGCYATQRCCSGV